MSRIAKWKVEKTKVKVVFRLQFHATHIPQSGWDKLFISFIPADSAKATAKTTKANVRNGTCKWADPIYETTRLLQDVKTRQYDEKLYKLVIAMGTSRSSVLGESIIDLADYADASKPSTASLPLHGCDSATVLHVTIQLLTSKTGFREFEQQRELRETGLQTTTDQHSPHESSGGRLSEETSTNQTDKVNRVRLKERFKELPSVEEEVGPNEEYADSATGYDGSSNTSGSVCAEKQDTPINHEINSLKSASSGDLARLSRSLQRKKGNHSDLQGTNGWVHGWTSEYEENATLGANVEAAESSILELKQEVSSLQRHANEIGGETQKFAEQLVAEISSGDQMANEVSVLKLECSKLKGDLDELAKLKIFPRDWQLRWFVIVEDKIRELQSKACFGYHERDFGLLQLDFEMLLGLLENLKSGTEQEIPTLTISPSDLRENLHKCSQVVPGIVFDTALCQPELGVPHSVNLPGLVSLETDHLDVTSAMKEKVLELSRELEESKAERESLVKKMDQMECYYEALIHELEENQRQMLWELQSLRSEHSTCIFTISSNNAEMEKIHQELSNQILKHEAEKHDFDSLNKELERRAVTAEAALKRARLNYSIAVDHLQKDLELLSVQVLSMYETNDDLIRQVFVDPSQSSYNIQGTLENVQNRRLDSEGTKLRHFQKQQQLGGDILIDDLKRSLDVQGRLYHKVEEEISEMHFTNTYLDVFSTTLQEILLEANSGIRLMQHEIYEISQQLEVSNGSRDSLMRQLHNALDEVHFLTEYKATCTTNCNELALQNQLLESSLQDLNRENYHLKLKITEFESLMLEHQMSESSYEAEKTELACLLNKESLDNANLRNEISSLLEELNNVKSESVEMASVNESLQNSVDFLQNKLKNILSSYDKSFSGTFLWSESACRDLESKDLASIGSLTEELQHRFCEMVLQLVEERKCLVDERDTTQISLSNAKSDVQGMADKLNVSNSMMQKLQSEMEAVAKRLEASYDIEEKYEQLQNELVADLNCFELELQQLTSRNIDLAEEISAFETVNNDLEISKKTMAELVEENQTLATTLQKKMEESTSLTSELFNLKESLQSIQVERCNEKSLRNELESKVSEISSQLNEKHCQLRQEKTEETASLASEFFNLKENFHSIQEELCNKKSLRNELESKVSELTSQLNEKHCRLLQTDEQISELVHFKQLALDLEQERSKVCRLLSNSEQCLAKAREESCSISTLLRDMHEFSIAADVRLVFTKSQYETSSEEVLQQLSSSDRDVAKLRKEHLDAQTALNRSLTEGLKSELNAANVENGALCKTNGLVTAELQEYKRRAGNLEAQDQEHLQQLSSTHRDLAELRSALSRSLASEAHCTEENAKLVKSLDSLTSELDAVKAENSLRTVDLQEYKKKAENLEAKAEERFHQLSSMNEAIAELHKKRVDAESALNHCLEENAKLLSSLLSARSQLEAADDEKRLRFNTNSQLKSVVQEYKMKVDNLEAEVEEHLQQLSSTENYLSELRKKHLESETALEHCLAIEAQRTEENENLLKSLDLLRSEFAAEKRELFDVNHLLTDELEEHKRSAQNIDESYCVSKSELAHEVKKLKHLLLSSEDQIDNLTMLKEELEVKLTVIGAKLDEQHAEMRWVQTQCIELSQRLSEQILKTEEFKNLFVHLKELKDKADAECHQAREPAAAQDSLRIAFIKDQYESKVQELKQQLSISKRHGEDLLWKLQDAVDEIENRKKFEASHLKKNEELGMKMLELEAKLQSVVSEKREKMRAYDVMKAELECSLVSLECCKDDKIKLESFLKESNEERSRVQNTERDESEKAGISDHRSLDIVSCNGSLKDLNRKSLDRGSFANREAEGSLSIGEGKHSSMLTDVEHGQDVHGGAGENGTHNQEKDTHLSLINDQFRAQSLKSSMNNLNKELERMKNENLLDFDDDDGHRDSQFPGLQRELMQLQKTNQELGSMFPTFKEYSDSGKALERVLALEIELAGALQAKKKSKIQFQSSFVKQHSDEETVFKSFRDINELIKDMLEVKERYSSVEGELKEMHDRYSQLSLQFAEVEGERQRLMMTLKNLRASRKPQTLNRASSTSVAAVDYTP